MGGVFCNLAARAVSIIAVRSSLPSAQAYVQYSPKIMHEQELYKVSFALGSQSMIPTGIFIYM